ncbi:MAG TPA: hypothetical protein DCO89_01360 [Clostridiales bacterium]|nr:hypothetical protein [Clostridiales bacterium]
MKINDVIKEVAIMLQLSNVSSAYLSNFENLDTQTQRDVNLLLSCANEVLSDIATDHLPLKFAEEITVTSGQFNLSGLSKTFHKLISIETAEDYSIELDTLKIKSGKYKITYNFLPEIYEIGDTIADCDIRITSYALGFGIAAEYCLICGNYSESEMWNSRFESAVQIARRSAKMPKLKERRWI